MRKKSNPGNSPATEYLMPILLPLAWLLLVVFVVCCVKKRWFYKCCKCRKGLTQKQMASNENSQVSEKDLRNLAKYPIYTLGENGGVFVASLDETVLNGRNSRDGLSRNEQPDCSKYSEEHISVVPNTTYTLMMNDLSSITENSYISSERL